MVRHGLTGSGPGLAVKAILFWIWVSYAEAPQLCRCCLVVPELPGLPVGPALFQEMSLSPWRHVGFFVPTSYDASLGSLTHPKYVAVVVAVPAASTCPDR